MDLEDRMSARQIVKKAGMSSRPEFYSGRGAISSDLNGDILEKIHQGVEREHGQEAAEQFTRMISDIPKLSATDFLLNLYRLEGNNWDWSNLSPGNEKGVYVDGSTDEEKIAVGHFTVGSALGGMLDRDETSYISGEFLEKHRAESH